MTSEQIQEILSKHLSGIEPLTGILDSKGDEVRQAYRNAETELYAAMRRYNSTEQQRLEVYKVLAAESSRLFGNRLANKKGKR